MPDFISKFIEKIQQFWNKLEKNQRIMMVGGAFVLIVGFALFLFIITKPKFSLLYTKLSQEDANRVVTALQQEKVTYRLEDNGTTIMVPESAVYELRIKLAGQGAILGQGIGLEIFDNTNIGQTEYVQRINYQRALQGELSRTLSEFPNVESARVHLVIPERSLFIEDQQPPSASVILRLQESGIKMTDREVNSIVNLLISAVEGLDVYHISVTDNAGRSLFTPEDENSGVNSTQLDYRIRLESMLAHRIDELLLPVLGPGRHIAKVSADLDFSQRTISREFFDPDSRVVRSEQRTEEMESGTADLGGSTDVNYRGDGLTGAFGNQEASRESRTTNYEINREAYNIVGQMGEVTRLTVAVAVDGTYARNAEGVWEYIPRTDEDLQQIRQLVANAVGFDADRGDTLEVTSLAFGETEMPVEPNVAQLLSQFAERMGGPLITALLAFMFIMMVVRPVVLALIRPRVEAGEVVEGLEGLPAAEEQFALYEAQEEAARLAAESIDQAVGESETYSLELGLTLDDIKARALQLAEHNLDQTIYILRNWLKTESKTK